jgi:hypothetical protein
MEALERAQEFRPAPEEVARHGIPWGPGRLLSKLRSGEGPTPTVVRRGGSGRARTAVVLGDLFFEMMGFEKAAGLFGRLNPAVVPVAERDLNAPEAWSDEFDVLANFRQLLSRGCTGGAAIRAASPLQRAYARYKQGRAGESRGQLSRALAMFGEFLDEYAASPWACESLVRAATMCNQMVPARSAPSNPSPAERLHDALLEEVVKRDPRGPWGANATLFLVGSARWYGDYDEAIVLLRQLRRRMASPEVRRAVEEEMAEIIWLRKAAPRGEGDLIRRTRIEEQAAQ